MREGSEVRDLKAWLYRVVHNTAVNALRDSAHDGQPLPDPTLGPRFDQRTDDSQLDRGMAMREALAEVAALPPLQREVIVRTAVAGHSHEQVASDLGITNGAVRGLLYRARTTLRTGVTALTPPPLLGWLAGRSNQGNPAPERLAELAGGGGTAVGVGGAGAAGVSGLLLKGGAVALTVGTVITGAAVVHLSASTPHRRHRLIASAASPRGAGAGSTATGSRSVARYGELSAATTAGAGARRGNSGRRAGRGAGRGGKTPGTPSGAGGGGSAGAPALSGGNRAPRSTARTTGGAHDAPAKTPAEQSPAPKSTQRSSPAGGGSGGGSGAGSGQSGGSGESGSGSGGPAGSGSGGPAGSGSGGPVGSGSGGPVGSAAGNGSPGGSDTGGSSGSTSGSSAEGGVSGGGQSGSGIRVRVGLRIRHGQLGKLGQRRLRGLARAARNLRAANSRVRWSGPSFTKSAASSNISCTDGNTPAGVLHRPTGPVGRRHEQPTAVSPAQRRAGVDYVFRSRLSAGGSGRGGHGSGRGHAPAAQAHT